MYPKEQEHLWYDFLISSNTDWTIKAKNKWIQALAQNFFSYPNMKKKHAEKKSHQDYIRLSYSPHIHFLIFSTCYHDTSWFRSYCQTCYVGTVSNKLFYKTTNNFYCLVNFLLPKRINFFTLILIHSAKSTLKKQMDQSIQGWAVIERYRTKRERKRRKSIRYT